MSFKDLFKKSSPNGPEVVELKKEKKPKASPEEVFDFSYNEHRFGRKGEVFFKNFPVPASLYGFFKYETEEISREEYLMWKDSLENPADYVIYSESLGRGFKKLTIKKKN